MHAAFRSQAARATAVAVSLTLAALAGCAHPPPAPETAAQSWFTAKAAYTEALSAAARYRVDCQRKVERLQGRCMEVVAALRDIDREAEDIEELGDMAYREGDDEFLEEAASELERLRDEMEESVLNAAERESP